MTCPVECSDKIERIKDDIRGIKKTLFGDDGYHGIVQLIDSCVTWKSIACILAIIVTLFLAGITAWSEEKEKRQENTKILAVASRAVDLRIGSLEKSIIELSRVQIILAEKINNQLTANEMKKIIKEAVKEGNKP